MASGLSEIKRALRPFHLSIAGFGLMAAAIVLAWLGFQATQEWQRSTRLLVDQRTSEALTLMIMALNRDMRGVEGEVLPQLESLDVHTALHELSDEVTIAFARFPYPESFFIWTSGGAGPRTLYAFNRTDRRPSWDTVNTDAVAFPTTIVRNPSRLAPLIRMLQRGASRQSRAVLLETRIDDEICQVIARPRYGGPSGTDLQALTGFTVNLAWVRAHYFSELVSQLSRVLTPHSSVALTVLDENGRTVTTNHPSTANVSDPQLPFREQRFPLLFFDPVLRTTMPEETLPIRYWTARIDAVEDKSMIVAAAGAGRTFTLISIATLAATIALISAVRSARAAALLAAMKSEFVSTVTHELKTPLSSIRLASETLVRGRYRSPDVIVQYAELLLKDASRLTRTVDNLLAITRVQDVQGFYMFEPLDLLTLVEEALSRFELQVKEQGFELHVDIPASLPPVRADRAAMLQVLDNLLDNAIRYSNGNRTLTLSASAREKQISLCITDSGPGIPTDELPRVFDKFFRGRNISAAGSGLGLAIAQRLMHDHGGAIRLHSSQGHGTTAEVLLCPAKEQDSNETKDSGR
jgi:signal transduction histidine kinase